MRDMKELKVFGVFVILLTLCFGGVIYELVMVAKESDLHSHILLVPFLFGFLIFLLRKRLPQTYDGSRIGGLGFAGVGIGFFVAGFVARGTLSQNDWLSIHMASYLFFLGGGLLYFLGKDWIKAAAFPLFFLLFLIPLPDGVVHLGEKFLSHTTALALEPLFRVAGVPALRDGQVFHVPGITIEVARECSGIRSTLVLLIVGILAAYLFLAASRFRALLVALLLPLGILRNAFRILVISALCVHKGPEMINSPIHRDGGPWFFALSLIALVCLVWILRRFETRGKRDGNRCSERGKPGMRLARVQE